MRCLWVHRLGAGPVASLPGNAQSPDPDSRGHLVSRARAGVSGGRKRHDLRSVLYLAPEGVDAGVPVVGRLLEGLMGFLFHNLELGSWDQLGDGAAELRAAGRVEPAGEDERGRGDLRGGALGPA